MTSSFTNILIPVDFSKNTELAVLKAIELVRPEHSVICLFYVSYPNPVYSGSVLFGSYFVTPTFKRWNNGKIEMRMQPYHDKIKESLPLTKINTYMVAGGGVQQNIIEAANMFKADLIIIGKNKSRKWFPFLNTVDPSSVAKKTESPVLVVKPGALNNKMKSIVVPVQSAFPQRKIELLKALTERSKAKIYLVTTHNKNTETGVFVETYRTISEYMRYPVQYKILEGHNFPKAIFDYAKKIGADLILANPYTETKINVVYGTDICDLISPSSKLAVLAAEPFSK